MNRKTVIFIGVCILILVLGISSPAKADLVKTWEFTLVYGGGSFSYMKTNHTARTVELGSYSGLYPELWSGFQGLYYEDIYHGPYGDEYYYRKGENRNIFDKFSMLPENMDKWTNATYLEITSSGGSWWGSIQLTGEESGSGVPEPATVISALLGLLGFAVKKFLRR